MVRVPVPDDYERGHISVAGASDYHYGEADINLDDVDKARDLAVAEDDGGRYVGAPVYLAGPVAEYLGVEAPETVAEPSEENAGDGPDADDGDESGEDDPPTCAGNDGACSREVDEPGGRCWQHEEEG